MANQTGALQTILLYLKGAKSSKTITLNGILTTLIAAGAIYYGVDLDPATVAILVSVVYTILNWVLRFTTNTSLPEKALQKQLKRPEWISVLATEIINQLKREKAEAMAAQKSKR